MSVLRRWGAALRARPGVVAIVSLGVAWAVIMHAGGWAQQAHFAEVRALASGRAEIDRWHWETGDKAWIDGHFYSVKSPGLAVLSLPFYAVIDAFGGRDLARDAAANARQSSHPRTSSPRMRATATTRRARFASRAGSRRIPRSSGH